MKVTTHVGWLLFFAFLLIGGTWLLTEYLNIPSGVVSVKKRGDNDLVTFKLPSGRNPANKNPNVFGPPFWEARHTLAEMTPCPSCRQDAVTHEKFFHDWVNKKTGKQMKFKENYEEWKKTICEEKTY